MSAFVLDASAALAWLFGEEQCRAELAEAIETAEMTAPWLWRVEVTNAILVRERRGHFSAADGTRFLQIAEALEIDIVSDLRQRSLEALANFARPHQLSSYDALYLELAVSSGIPLCTVDKNLEEAAKRIGVELLDG